MTQVAIYAVKVETSYEFGDKGKILVCSSKDPEGDFVEHKNMLKLFEHPNVRLQYAFVGMNHAYLEVLEWCDKKDTEDRKRWWIADFGPDVVVNPANAKEQDDDKCSAKLTKLKQSIKSKEQRKQHKKFLKDQDFDLVDVDLQWTKPTTIDDFLANIKKQLSQLESPEGRAALKKARIANVQ